MKSILKEIRHCRERNLILFGELKSKLDIVEEAFLRNIEEVESLQLRESENGRKMLHLNDEELEVHSMISDEDIYYVAIEKEGRYDGDIVFDMVYSAQLAK